MAEVAKGASVTAETQGREQLKTDPHQALVWFEHALEYDRANNDAAEALNALRKAISNSAEQVSTALALVDRGEVVSAEQHLRSAAPYKHELGSYDLAQKRLYGAKAALDAQQLWRTGQADEALEKLLVAEKVAPDCTLVQTISKAMRPDISNTLAAKAEAVKAEALSQYVEQLTLLRKATEIDSGNANAGDATVHTLAALRRFVDTASRTSSTTRESSGARVALERYRAVEDLLPNEKLFTRQVADTHSHAYPAVGIRVVVGESQGCVPVFDQGTIVAAIRAALDPVARVDNQNWELTLQVSGITCSATDIPRELVQRANSTYAAAQNQLANPTYTRLQTELAAAEQELNRAYVEYTTNTNFATGYMYGKAQRTVRQLRASLSNTAPYITQDIMQQYQYEKFEALRSYRTKATIELYSKDEKSLTPANVSGDSEQRKPGVTGVLPQDRSGATNLTPAMLPMEDHARKSWEEIKKRIDTQSRELLAAYLATIARDQKSATSDRLAAILYLRDIAGGTKYDGRVNKDALQKVVFSSPQAVESFLDGLSLPVPEQAVRVQVAGVPHKLDLQTAATGVVSIETDSGNAGSGFFVTSGCLIVTNKHVIDRAETIIARDSARKIYVASVLAQDTERDLALLSTTARACTVLPLGDSNRAVIGKEIYAIGNPLGLSGTVTRGIVSGLRSGGGVSYIQIDATINPGNSGGPLLDETGSVLGVTTFKVKGFEGLNFAVASNEIGNAFGRFLPR